MGQAEANDSNRAEPPIQKQQDAERIANALIKLAVAILATTIVKCSFFPGTAFDKPSWDHDVDGGNGTRHAMAERLVHTGELIGLTGPSVVNMLGEPITHKEFTDWDLVFDLGPARGLIPTGRSFLVIMLDSGGLVQTSRMMCDG